MRAFENRTTYDATQDAVGVISLRVECAPGQVDALLGELVNIRDKAGVYCVEFDMCVREPAKSTEGEAHGESPIQLADAAEDVGAEGRHPDAGDGHGNDADEGRHASDAGEDGELAGPAGQGGAGSLGGDAEVQAAPEVRGDLTDMLFMRTEPGLRG